MDRPSASHPFLDPLWRRVVLVAFCAVWCIFEWVKGDPFWGALTAGMTLYGAWSYLWKYEVADGSKDP